MVGLKPLRRSKLGVLESHKEDWLGEISQKEFGYYLQLFYRREKTNNNNKPGGRGDCFENAS